MIKNPISSKSLPIKRNSVKAQIVAAGVKLSDLARASNCSPAAITRYLNGTLKCTRTRREIWIAFRGLSGSRVSFERFWDQEDAA
jgi:hypothetical protein